MLICPQKAVTEREKAIGKIQKGSSEQVKVLSGILKTGEVSGVPIIKNLLKEIKNNNQITIIDCPPGSACIVMESIKDADYCVLVAEPTAFGVHNLNMVYELVTLFHKPYGVVLNKCLDGENPAEIFCKEKGITILGKIPFETEISTLNSNAKIAVREKEKYHTLFSVMLQNVMKEVQHETTVNP
jgi:MinD superfamily P-loop ATPase